jgi:hypothetical protein
MLMQCNGRRDVSKISPGGTETIGHGERPSLQSEPRPQNYTMQRPLEERLDVLYELQDMAIDLVLWVNGTACRIAW